MVDYRAGIQLGRSLLGRRGGRRVLHRRVAPLLLIIGENHRPGHTAARPWHVFGGLLTAGVLIPLSFHDFHTCEPSRLLLRLPGTRVAGRRRSVGPAGDLGDHRSPPGTRSTAHADEIQRGAWARLADLTRRQWVPLAISAGAIAMGLFDIIVWGTNTVALVPTIIANLAMITLAIWLMHVGLRNERGVVFATGVCYFVLWSVLRYVDLFADASGMLGAAGMFFLCGLMLFACRRSGADGRSGSMSDNAFRFDAGEAWLGPDWLNRPLTWCRDRRRTLLILTGVFQIVLLAVMTTIHAAPLIVGDTIMLKVEPIDPRDLFRGDYVTLAYAISRVPPDGIQGIADSSESSSRFGSPREAEERTVYVSLEPDKEGVYWHATKISIHCPASGKFLRGVYRRERMGRVTCSSGSRRSTCPKERAANTKKPPALDN